MSEKRKKKGGRPCKYYSHVKPFFPQILEMCRTHTEAQIAEELGVGKSAFAEYKRKFPELREVLKKGRQNLVAELRSSLIKKANGYSYVESKETYEQVKWDKDLYNQLIDAGFSKKQLDSARCVKSEKIVKHVPPDVAAINLALKNYDKENWANDPQMLDIRKKELELKERQIENNEW